MAYIYTHTRLDKNEVFYVGIGFGNKHDKNYKRAHQKTKRNIFWNRIVNKTDYRIDIIEDGLTREDALKREAFWIKKYGRRDLNEGTLVNMTNGGDGGDTISKHPNKESILRKMSELSAGKNNPNYGGKFLNREYIEKQIKSNSHHRYKVINTITGEVSLYLSENQISKGLNIPRSTINSCRKDGRKVRKIYQIIESKDIV